MRHPWRMTVSSGIRPPLQPFLQCAPHLMVALFECPSLHGWLVLSMLLVVGVEQGSRRHAPWMARESLQGRTRGVRQPCLTPTTS